ncbi:iron-sulfur clusters transporter atm1, mitochondrial precursor [Ectocarpus siliculosus]|uniref:Iron-sulfur clusters transporter atm1, mitochondrial n=1 Tax=Ectocarpus siliculosus TaxID=2880 RepID=D8LUA8_ECTSI|nr:iron-sulfur clusters transporter atm1, mitochondrial precursor [Ectocarpus siliculosus]|eukprot:CBN75449.1 iron-sulfur clusters transporter atm1, mitochondrial precursor [Ectocarpus siliculosus]
MTSSTGTGGADADDRSGGNGERKRRHPAAGTGDQGQPPLGGRGACRATAPSIAPAVKRTEEAEEASERDNAKRILRTLATHLWPSKELQADHVSIKARVVGSLALLLGAKLVTIQVPFIFKGLVDTLGETSRVAAAAAAATGDAVVAGGVSPEAAVAVPVSMVLGYGIARSTASGAQELRNVVFAVVAQRAIRRVGRDVFEHLHDLGLKYHLEKNTGTVSRIIDRGGRSIQYTLSAMLFNVLPTIVEISLVSGILASQASWKYSAVCCSTIVTYSAYTFGITQWRTKFRKQMIAQENEASAKVTDSLVNYETVKYFNNEAHEASRYDESLKGFQEASVKTQTSLSMLNVGQHVIFSTGLTAIMALAASDIAAGHSTVGDLVLVNGLLFQLAIPLGFVGSTYREVRQALIDMTAMFKISDTVPQVTDREGAAELVNADVGGISFTDVRFGYGPDREILKGLTFEVPAGQTVAIVGHSGCGKSTIMRLLYRFFDINSGSIKIAGQDIKEVSQASLRRAVGVVPQDTVLFNDTIGYNIAYGDLCAGTEEVEEAARKAQLDSSIASMPQDGAARYARRQHTRPRYASIPWRHVLDFVSAHVLFLSRPLKGYGTVVGERGLMISGGEKQRVAIARAMLKNAPILLCDEPTSSLDTKTETEIMGHLKTLGRNRTSIIIAHRLSTVKDADKIIVLDQGKVVEEGNHAELMADTGGRYFGLWQAQRAWAAEESTAEDRDGSSGGTDNESGGGDRSSPP